MGGFDVVRHKASCPNCGAQGSYDTLIQHNYARSSLLRIGDPVLSGSKHPADFVIEGWTQYQCRECGVNTNFDVLVRSGRISTAAPSGRIGRSPLPFPYTPQSKRELQDVHASLFLHSPDFYLKFPDVPDAYQPNLDKTVASLHRGVDHVFRWPWHGKRRKKLHLAIDLAHAEFAIGRVHEGRMACHPIEDLIDGKGRPRISNAPLRDFLLSLIAEDERVRAELAAEGSLFDGYHPRMEAVHVKNAAALEPILTAGWPGIIRAGEDGAEAAWRIVQHAIGLPHFQRRCLVLIEAAIVAGDAPAWQAAYLSDRIASFEGRPQLYGTQFDWDDAGQMSPLPVEDEANVEARRAALGLPPLAEITARQRADAGRAPPDHTQRKQEREAWLRRTGWRS